MKNQQADRRCGFSLLEILITTIILAVGVIAVVKALADGTSLDHNVENKVVASLLAQEQIESQMSVGSFSDIVGKAKADVDGFPGYKSEVMISGIDPKQLTVNVYWTTKDGEQKVTLHTLLTNLMPDS